MANQEQLKILKQGVKVWNEWREENNDVLIDLSFADFSNQDLTEVMLFEAYLHGIDFSNTKLWEASFYKATLFNANFSNADLSEAKLSEAQLSNANFFNANLYRAELSEAKLTNVNLTEAYLSEAFLSEADFYEANLSKTNLSNTDLSYANLTKAVLTETNFENCFMDGTILGLTNLGAAKNLATVKFGGECTIDFQTLRNSKSIPKEFLLKIGLPENFINYLPDFYNESPLRLFPVFLSHSWANKEFAGKLYDALIKKGVLVWYDEKKLRAGDKIFEGLTKAIDVYDKMILVCSKESLEESWWVDEEMNRIFKKERTYLKEKKKNVSLLIPITIDEHIYKWEGAKGESIRDKVIGDFSEWQDDTKFEKALNELIEALNVDRGEENITSYI